MVLFLSFINFLLCVYLGCKRFISGRLTFMYWLGSLFFVGIPLFFDMLVVQFGYGESLEKYLYLKDVNFNINFNNINLIGLSFFILVCNIFFAIGESFFLNKKNIEKSKYGQFEILLLFFNYIFLLVFLINYPSQWFVADFYRETNFIYSISSLMVVICTSSSFIFLLNNKKLLAFLGLFPCVFLSFLTAERPYLAPVIGIIFLWMANNKKNNIFNLIRLLIMGFLSITIMRLVRLLANNHDINIFDLLLERDSSTSVLYYIFENYIYYQALTGGKATFFLTTTGFYSDFIFGERNFSLVDIPSILAFEKFGWNFGTIHPTLYGWLFVDLGFFAVIFTFFLGFIISFMENKMKFMSVRLYSFLVVSLSLLIFVALRGSLQVAYSKSFYVIVIGGIMILIYNFLAKKFPKR